MREEGRREREREREEIGGEINWRQKVSVLLCVRE